MTKPLIILIAVMSLIIAAEGVGLKLLWSKAETLKTERDAARSTADQCEKDKALTSENADEQEKQNSIIRRQLDKLKRVPNASRCVPTPRAPAERNGPASAGELSGPHGVYAGDLLDFAGDAELVRQALISCQSFVNATWKSRGYN